MHDFQIIAWCVLLPRHSGQQLADIFVPIFTSQQHILANLGILKRKIIEK
jgi:hypothetical protein